MLQLANPSLLQNNCYIDGKFVPSKTGKRFKVANKASGEIIAEVADAGASETDLAIIAAHTALPFWRGLVAKQRAEIMHRWCELILKNQEDLALLMTSEQGKPLTESRGEVAYGASFVDWFAEEGRRIYGETIPTPVASRRLMVLKQPIGVVAAITPWNFPIAMITRKIAPALAAGCTVVIKPAEETPLCAIALVALAEQAGFPKGVINLVTGSDPAAIGDRLCASSVVRKLSFTGSTEIGRLLMRQCAPTIKKLSLELGGNAPFIVMDDADLDAAVVGAINSKFRNAGQTCVCANRILVQDGVYDEFAKRMVVAVEKLKVGKGTDDGVTQGPLINSEAVAKVEHHVADALSKGAKIATGGHRHSLGGTFFEPTVLTGVTTDMVVTREETFGPVAPLFRFKTEEEAIALANDSEFGLASYVYTRDIGRVMRMAERLEAGMVGVNEGIIGTAEAPFGGVKQSGIGREGSHFGMDDFLQIKYVCLGGIE
ncbi:MAG: NAD-dependent succinate-semialdehyde dehydrogenase [Candidatus Pacebacteria bacterium]|nr:NAD-dependent succinate-semialdehyde dehydrogenase [Candidatus Paceibacterota bacterium]